MVCYNATLTTADVKNCTVIVKPEAVGATSANCDASEALKFTITPTKKAKLQAPSVALAESTSDAGGLAVTVTDPNNTNTDLVDNYTVSIYNASDKGDVANASAVKTVTVAKDKVGTAVEVAPANGEVVAGSSYVATVVANATASADNSDASAVSGEAKAAYPAPKSDLSITVEAGTNDVGSVKITQPTVTGADTYGYKIESAAASGVTAVPSGLASLSTEADDVAAEIGQYVVVYAYKGSNLIQYGSEEITLDNIKCPADKAGDISLSTSGTTVSVTAFPASLDSELKIYAVVTEGSTLDMENKVEITGTGAVALTPGTKYTLVTYHTTSGAYTKNNTTITAPTE